MTGDRIKRKAHAGLVGNGTVPEEKRRETARFLAEVFRAGGMARLDRIECGDGRGFCVLVPPDAGSTNGFSVSCSVLDETEEDPITFDADRFCLSGRGSLGREDSAYARAHAAALMLMELQAEQALVVSDGISLRPEETVGWLNFCLGTKFTLEKRADVARVHDILERFSPGRTGDVGSFLARVPSGASPEDPAPAVSSSEFLEVPPDRLLFDWHPCRRADLSEGLREQLRTWSEEHREILKSGSFSSLSDKEHRRQVTEDLCRADETFTRIWTWKDVLTEQTKCARSPEYRAAWEIFRRIVKESETEKTRKLAERSKRLSWTLVPKELREEEGRTAVRNFLSLLHNKALRAEVFSF